MSDHEETLRRLAIHDHAYIQSIVAHDRDIEDLSSLDPKTYALVRIGALIAIGAASPSYMCASELAREHGATLDEIVGTLIAVMPAIGSDRVVAAAPILGLALGYDVAEALEQLEPDRPRLGERAV